MRYADRGLRNFSSILSKSPVQALLAKDADVLEKDNNGWTPLLLASDRGYTPIIQVLLDKGADIQTKEPKQGKTALHLAAAGGHVAVVQVRIQAARADKASHTK